MSYLSIEFDGQPLGAMEPFALVAGEGVGLESHPALPSVGLEDVSLAFNSFDDVSAHIMRSRPMKEAIVDETYPHTNEAQLMWVKAIYKALLNGADTIDGDKLIKQWESMIAENKVNIELVAWKTLRRVMLYHTLEGKLEPDNIETRKYRSWDSFADHMTYMLEVLAVKKTLCRHLATDTWTAAFIDAPELHSLRVDSNRKINNAKRAKVDAGNAALKHVKNVVETGSVGGVEKVAEMQALIDTAPISVPRAQPKETDGPEPAPSRSRDRTTATTVTKTAKSRNRPTLREKKTASRSARVTQEKTRTKEAIIDEDDIDAIGSPDLSTQYAVPTGAQWKQGMGTHQPQGYQPTVWNAGHSIHQPSAAGNHLVGYVSASNFNHGEVQTQNNHVLRNASGVNSTMYGSHNQGSYAANNGYPSTELNYHHSLMPGTFPQEFPLNGQNNWELGHTSSSATTTAAATAPMHWSTTTNGNFPQGTLSSVPIMVPTSDGIYLPNISYTATPNHHNDTAAQDYNGVKYTDEY